MKKRRFTERHITAFNVLGFAIILSDPRITTGTIGWMIGNYSRNFVLFWAFWAFCGVAWLIVRKASALSILIAAMPIFAYAVMGLWYYLFGSNTPIAALILPLLIAGDVLWFINTRIQATARGGHDDDTLPTRPE